MSAALLPRMESGERSEAPTAAAGDSSSNSRFQQLTGDIRNGTEYFIDHLRHHRVAVRLYGLSSPSWIRNGETVHIKGKPIMSATYRGDSWKISPSFLGIFSLTRRANVGRSFAFFPRERLTIPDPRSIAVGVGRSNGDILSDRPPTFSFNPCVSTVGNNPYSFPAVRGSNGTSRNNERLDFISKTFEGADDVEEDVPLLLSV